MVFINGRVSKVCSMGCTVVYIAVNCQSDTILKTHILEKYSSGQKHKLAHDMVQPIEQTCIAHVFQTALFPFMLGELWCLHN